jgi:hypothetical protein
MIIAHKKISFWMVQKDVDIRITIQYVVSVSAMCERIDRSKIADLISLTKINGPTNSHHRNKL